MALRCFSYLRSGVQTCSMYPNSTKFSYANLNFAKHAFKALSNSQDAVVAGSYFNRNIYTCTNVLSAAQSQLKNEKVIKAKTDDTEKLKYENWESVLKQGEVEQSDDDDGDVPSVVYLGVLTSQIRRVKLFSLVTSVIGLTLQPVLLMQSADIHVAATVVSFAMIAFFTYVTPILIHTVSKRYVCEIVFDPKSNSYTSTTYNFFLQKKQLTFQTAHVEVPDVPGPFTTFIVNTADGRRTPLFVAPNTFTKPRHYAKLMGYDKPINLHLEDDNDINHEIKNRRKST